MDDDDIVAALRRGEDGWEYAAADEIEALRAENAQKRDALIGTLAALIAAVSLLEHGGKKAMPSDKMFEQMLSDFNETIRAARAAMGESDE